MVSSNYYQEEECHNLMTSKDSTHWHHNQQSTSNGRLSFQTLSTLWRASSLRVCSITKCSLRKFNKSKKNVISTTKSWKQLKKKSKRGNQSKASRCP